MSTTFTPLTCVNRIEDIELPEFLSLGGRLVRTPKTLRNKDVHYLINVKGKPIRAAWISKILAHILNSERLEGEGKSGELTRALESLDDHLMSLIREHVLRDRRGPGAMSFSQSNENVPEDAILLSARTYHYLCACNPKWKKTKYVLAERFPNLGPETTKRLRLIVNKPSSGETFTLRDKIPAEILFLLEDSPEVHCNIMDAFYFHPKTLKDCFQGDGDGDQAFIVIDGIGTPTFQQIDLTRVPASINPEDIKTLLSKCQRVDRSSIQTWLPNYLDDLPIDKATYAIRWKLFNSLSSFKDSKHPMHSAWQQQAQAAIELIEFVMDVRKGEFSDKEIQTKMDSIEKTMQEIRAAKEKQNWFALTVTSGKTPNMARFIELFPTLKSYLTFITTGKTNVQ